MKLPRDHHYIPIFLLKQWCDTEGKIVEFSQKNGKLISKRVGPGGTAFERDLYAFPELPGPESQFIEAQFLNYADDVASNALQVHLTDPSALWTQKMRSGWSRFVIGIQHRHPDAMKEIRPAVIRLWEKSGVSSQLEYEKLRKPTDPATFEEYIEKLDPTIPVKARIRLITSAIFDNEKIGTHINGILWTVIDVSHATYDLLLSDRPVMRYNFGKPEGFIALPISRRKLFLAANHQSTIDKIAAANSKEVVRRVNWEVVTKARRFVFAFSEAQRNFVGRYMGTQLEPTPFYPSIGQ